MKIRFGHVLIFAMLLQACEYIVPKTETEEVQERKALARVNEKYLYEDEMVQLIDKANSPTDSANLATRFINSWIRTQLLLQKAEQSVEVNQYEIERKVQDYRYALISYEFKKDYIKNNLDTLVTNEEIQAYYEGHIDNFLLNQNIIRGRYVQVTLDAPKLNKLTKWIVSENPKDINNLSSYCFQFANNYSLVDSIWFNFDDIILNTPMVSITNKIQFLKMNKMIETQDSTYKYLLYIKEYKIQDQLSPIEFVQDQIRNIIVNRRKVALSKELENKIYAQAVEQNSFEIYTN